MINSVVDIAIPNCSDQNTTLQMFQEAIQSQSKESLKQFIQKNIFDIYSNSCAKDSKKAMHYIKVLEISLTAASKKELINNYVCGQLTQIAIQNYSKEVVVILLQNGYIIEDDENYSMLRKSFTTCYNNCVEELTKLHTNLQKTDHKATFKLKSLLSKGEDLRGLLQTLKKADAAQKSYQLLKQELVKVIEFTEYLQDNLTVNIQQILCRKLSEEKARLLHRPQSSGEEEISSLQEIYNAIDEVIKGFSFVSQTDLGEEKRTFGDVASPLLPILSEALNIPTMKQSSLRVANIEDKELANINRDYRQKTLFSRLENMLSNFCGKC